MERPLIRSLIVPGPEFGLGFLTGSSSAGRAPRETFDGFAAAIAGLGIAPLQEKIYGRASMRARIMAMRADAYRAHGVDPAPPASFHQGKPSGADDFSGAQLFGIVPGSADVRVSTVHGGRMLTGKDFRFFYSPAITGLSAGDEPADPASQARRMFESAAALLSEHGFSFTQVPRTWIYLARILDWYPELNRVRNAFFEQHGVGADPARSFPASTGIQGMTGSEECSMDVLAVDGPGAAWTPLSRSARQGSAADYGSSFSRAASLTAGGLEMILVSGTASIGPDGESLHHGDAKAQVDETLDCISDLLSIRGAGLQDVVLSTVFCKEPGVKAVFEKAVARRGLADFPFVPLVADVCRDELLIEIEALAARGSEAR